MIDNHGPIYCGFNERGIPTMLRHWRCGGFPLGAVVAYKFSSVGTHFVVSPHTYDFASQGYPEDWFALLVPMTWQIVCGISAPLAEASDGR